MIGRSPTVATNATTQAISLAVWKDIYVDHSGEKPFACTQCKYSTMKAQNRKSHIFFIWEKNPFSCKQCNYSSTVSSHLKKQLLSHSGEKLFSCSQCSFSCTQAGNLKIHIRTIREKVVQLWSMQLFNHSGCSSESTHAQAHWRKNF